MAEKYTLKERLMLANQYEILSLLHKDDEKKSQHYATLKTIFVDGYQGLYDGAVQLMEDELSEPETNFVTSVLSMYIAIYRSTLHNGEDSKELEGQPIYFSGFDIMNMNEYRYLSLTESLMNNYILYSEIKNMIEEKKFTLHAKETGPSMAILSKMTVRAKYLDKLLAEEDRKFYTNAEILDIIHTR